MSHSDETEGRLTPRPNPLAQVGHEGNPVLFDLPIVGVLDGTPALVPPRLPTGGSGATPLLPLSGGGGGGNCYEGTCADVFVTGGVPPYSFSSDVGTFVVNESGTGGTLCEGPNPGESESPGIAAYGKQVKYCCTFTSCSQSAYNCAGQALVTCSLSAGVDCGLGTCACSVCSNCANLAGCVNSPSCACASSSGDGACAASKCCGVGGCCGSDGCQCLRTRGTQCDVRSGNGLSADCQPCAIQFQDGAVVTVIDSNGTTILIPLEWSTDEE